MKVVYEKEIDGVKISIELLNGVDNTDLDEDVLGYTIQTHNDTYEGLLLGKDLAIYIASLESGYFVKLAKASQHKSAFVNDLVRANVIGKNSYIRIYEGTMYEENIASSYDFIKRCQQV